MTQVKFYFKKALTNKGNMNKECLYRITDEIAEDKI